MSEKFIEKLVELLFGAIMVFLLFASSSIVLLAYVATLNVTFYYGFLAALGFSFVYVVQYSRQFRDFKETLYLLIPESNYKPIEPLGMETDELPLKVCLYYHNGATLNQIAENMGIKEAQQVKRSLIKGLDILLREHNEKVKK